MVKVSQASISAYKAPFERCCLPARSAGVKYGDQCGEGHPGHQKRLTKPSSCASTPHLTIQAGWVMEAEMLLAGRYRLDRPIGTGRMGQVWAAHDTRLGRDVAIKEQQYDPAGDEVAFERFQREAQSTVRLQHPNVVTIFDSGTDGNMAFLVMELLPGPTLQAYVAERGPLPEREAVALAAAVASSKTDRRTAELRRLPCSTRSRRRGPAAATRWGLRTRSS
jgi:Protein kinase domain